jgi:hypothetical protein
MMMRVSSNLYLNDYIDQGFPNYLSDTELFMRTRNQFVKREKTAESRGGGYR